VLGLEKRIRDPIHGDIRLSASEIELVDTQQFQRLRGIKQLGPAYLIYPAATHTRFEHSLGTLYMAQKIIDGVNSNAMKTQEKRLITEFGEKIVRLAALLHDITHEPFGHTIEDNLHLRERHNLHISNQWGAAVQFGFDYMLDRHWGLNVDVKKLWLRPDYSATVSGLPVTGTAHIDPWLVGGGVTYKF